MDGDNKRHQSVGFTMSYRLLNGVMFNIAWLGIVISQSSLIAPAVVIALLTAHLALMGKGPREWRFIAGFALTGFCVDQLLFRTGLFTVAGSVASPPLWMTCLWPALGTTFMHAFAALTDRPFLAAVVGGVGGGASYIAGTRLTEVAFAADISGPIIVAVLWAIIFPVALGIANREGGEAS